MLGLEIAATGIVVVFIALVLISVFIKYLPVLVGNPVGKKEPVSEADATVMAVIAAAIELEKSQQGEALVLPRKDNGNWRRSGRVRNLMETL